MSKLLILPELVYNKNKEWKAKVDEIYDSLDKLKIDSSWWYLHGKLESLVQFDKGIAYNYVELGLYKTQPDWSRIVGDKLVELRSSKTKHIMYCNKIIDCEVIGIEEPCIGYFWITNETEVLNLDGTKFPKWDQRGLVCLKSDKEANEYALKCYNEKTSIL